MFEYLWRHVCRFLKLHRMDRTSSSISLFNVDTGLKSKDFLTKMADVLIEDRAKCDVEQLIWYKHLTGSQHEFVVAKLANSAALMIERYPPADAKPLIIFSTSSPSSSKHLLAEDVVQIFRDPKTLDKAVSSRNAQQVYEHKFKPFPALELARIVAAISDYDVNYAISSAMCYWYAWLIMALTTQLFDVMESQKANGRGGKWKGLFTFKGDDEALRIIKGRYIQARDADPQPMGPTASRVMEERRLREMAEARAEQFQQGMGELQQGMDEERLRREKTELALERAERELEKYKVMAGHQEGH